MRRRARRPRNGCAGKASSARLVGRAGIDHRRPAGRPRRTRQHGAVHHRANQTLRRIPPSTGSSTRPKRSTRISTSLWPLSRPPDRRLPFRDPRVGASRACTPASAAPQKRNSWVALLLRERSGTLVAGSADRRGYSFAHEYERLVGRRAAQALRRLFALSKVGCLLRDDWDGGFAIGVDESRGSTTASNGVLVAAGARL